MMKKLLFTLCWCGLCAAGYGQWLDSYGLKLGLGLTNHCWKYKDLNVKWNWDNNYGIVAKGFGDIALVSFLSLEGEVGYAQKGARDKIAITTPAGPEGTGEYLSLNNRLNYVSVALLGKVKYKFNLFIPYIIAGPEYNYLLSKKIASGYEIIYDKLKRSIVGFTIGLGAEVKLVPITILVEYRYSKDLMNNYEPANIEIKNYGHGFLIGIKI